MITPFSKINSKRIGLRQWWKHQKAIWEFVNAHVDAGADHDTLMQRGLAKMGQEYRETWLNRLFKKLW